MHIPVENVIACYLQVMAARSRGDAKMEADLLGRARGLFAQLAHDDQHEVARVFIHQAQADRRAAAA